MQLTTWPGVSALIVVGAQGGELTADSGSTTVQVTVTSPMYQPLVPAVPVTIGVIAGGVPSPARSPGTVVSPPKLLPQQATVPSSSS